MRLSFSHALTRGEAKELLSDLSRQLAPAWVGWVMAATGVLAGAGALFLIVEVGYMRFGLSPPSLALAAMMMTLVIFVAFNRASGYLHSLPFRTLPDRWSDNWVMEADAEGLRVTHDHGTGIQLWSGLRGWVATPDVVMLIFASEIFYIPDAGCNSPASLDALARALREWAPDDAVEQALNRRSSGRDRTKRKGR
ncbi:MAG: hypothetical protein AAF311_07870 [Pseudomonadota bacterium]